MARTEGSRQLILFLVRRMPAHVDIRAIALLVMWAALAFTGLRQWYLRRLAARLFADHERDDTALANLRETLDKVNRECRTHSFFATRVANISLRDHPVVLVDGWIVAPGARGPHTETSVFAVADRNEADWLRNFSDIFEHACSGAGWSIFWVSLPRLMRLTKRCS